MTTKSIQDVKFESAASSLNIPCVVKDAMRAIYNDEKSGDVTFCIDDDGDLWFYGKDDNNVVRVSFDNENNTVGIREELSIMKVVHNSPTYVPYGSTYTMYDDGTDVELDYTEVNEYEYSIDNESDMEELVDEVVNALVEEHINENDDCGWDDEY